MTTVQDIFDKAITLMDEQSDAGQTDWGDTLEYKHKTLPILNMLQGELYTLSDTCPEPEQGRRPVARALEKFTDAVDLDDVLARTVLPYGLAAHLLLEENPTAAAFYQQRYEELVKKAGGQFPADWESIRDVYGAVSAVSFGRW